jgi:beta-phosphoglucomutase family hydrolase
VKRTAPATPVRDVRGWLFDLDGVLTPTADVHMRAWARLFAPYLAACGAAPYDDRDYYQHIDGRPRYDGVRSVLASRAIQIPEGHPGDSVTADTVCGLGNRKNEAFNEVLAREGVAAYPGSVAFLDSVLTNGSQVAVVSSSQNAPRVLEAAGLSDRFAIVIDGRRAAEAGLRGKPHPDTYLRAAELVGLRPADCAVVEDADSGIRAGVAGGFGLVVGVDRGVGHAALLVLGADTVVDDLNELVPLLSDSDS